MTERPRCAVCGRAVTLGAGDTYRLALGYAHGVCIRHLAARLEDRAGE